MAFSFNPQNLVRVPQAPIPPHLLWPTFISNSQPEQLLNEKKIPSIAGRSIVTWSRALLQIRDVSDRTAGDSMPVLKEVAKISSHRGDVAHFSDSRFFLSSVIRDQSLLMLDADSGEIVANYQNENSDDPLSNCQGKLCVCRVPSSDPFDWLVCLCVSPIGAIVWKVSNSRSPLVILDPGFPKVYQQILWCCCYEAHRRWIIGESVNTTIWDLDTGKILQKFEQRSEKNYEIFSSACSADLGLLFCGGYSHIDVWDLRSEESPSSSTERTFSRSLNCIGYARALHYAADLHLLVSLSQFGRIRLWDIRNDYTPVVDLSPGRSSSLSHLGDLARVDRDRFVATDEDWSLLQFTVRGKILCRDSQPSSPTTRVTFLEDDSGLVRDLVERLDFLSVLICSDSFLGARLMILFSSNSVRFRSFAWIC